MDRSERRRQLKEDGRLLANGLDAVNATPEQVGSLMRLLREQLRAARAAGSIDSLMTFFYDNMSKSVRRLREVPLACAKGCSHCCHSLVTASAPEVLFVRRGIAAAALSATRDAVRRSYEATSGLSPDERLANPTACPLLRERICSVYAHRPVVCRTAVSLNAALCERAFLRSSGEAIPTPAWFSLVRLGYDLALCGAIRKEGLSYVSCELNAALKSTLENDEAERQWLAGENVLAGLQEDPNGDPFRSEVNQQVYAAAFS
jgi:Fe-S-cluster containining protein